VNALRGIWSVMDARERRVSLALQVVAALMALGTVAGLAAVMPFFAVLTDTSLIERNDALRWLHARTGNLEEQHFLVLLGAGFLALLLVSSVINLFGAAAMTRFAHRVGDRLRIALFASYLERDYPFHLRRGGAALASAVLHQADRVTGMVHAAGTLASNVLTIALIFASIAFVDAAVSALVLSIFGLGYAAVYAIARRRLTVNGRLQAEAGAERVAVVEQGLAGIKDLLLSQSQQAFALRFARASRAISRAAASTQLIGQAPRYLLECIAGVALVAAALALGRRAPGGQWLAGLTFIAFAAYRLLPALQQAYFALVTLRANQPALQSIAADMTSPAAPGSPDAPPRTRACATVELIDVCFRHEGNAQPTLEHASLRIAAGSVAAFTGPNGSGKTTTADLLLGLLAPISGRIEIDGERLDARGWQAWKRNLACVPQQVFLLDSSVRENITLGADAAQPDEARLREAVRLAGAQDFIDALPQRDDQRIGDRGARLSGGQRQLIGLARALYRRPSFLVLDEVDSSLDADSAARLAAVLRRLHGVCTVVVITHDERLLNACDCRFEFGDRAVKRMDVSRSPEMPVVRLRSTP
jgi:ATP-binding cassette, subfamily B, bacterial PglK